MASNKAKHDAIIKAELIARRKFPVSERNYDRDELFLNEALYALAKSGERTEHVGRFDKETQELAIEAGGYLYIVLDPTLDGKRIRVTVEVLAEDDPA